MAGASSRAEQPAFPDSPFIDFGFSFRDHARRPSASVAQPVQRQTRKIVDERDALSDWNFLDAGGYQYEAIQKDKILSSRLNPASSSFLYSRMDNAQKSPGPSPLIPKSLRRRTFSIDIPSPSKTRRQPASTNGIVHNGPYAQVSTIESRLNDNSYGVANQISALERSNSWLRNPLMALKESVTRNFSSPRWSNERTSYDSPAERRRPVRNFSLFAPARKYFSSASPNGGQLLETSQTEEPGINLATAHTRLQEAETASAAEDDHERDQDREQLPITPTRNENNRNCGNHQFRFMSETPDQVLDQPSVQRNRVLNVRASIDDDNNITRGKSLPDNSLSNTLPVRELRNRSIFLGDNALQASPKSRKQRQHVPTQAAKQLSLSPTEVYKSPLSPSLGYTLFVTRPINALLSIPRFIYNVLVIYTWRLLLGIFYGCAILVHNILIRPIVSLLWHSLVYTVRILSHTPLLSQRNMSNQLASLWISQKTQWWKQKASSVWAHGTLKLILVTMSLSLIGWSVFRHYYPDQSFTNSLPSNQSSPSVVHSSIDNPPSIFPTSTSEINSQITEPLNPTSPPIINYPNHGGSSTTSDNTSGQDESTSNTGRQKSSSKQNRTSVAYRVRRSIDHSAQNQFHELQALLRELRTDMHQQQEQSRHHFEIEAIKLQKTTDVLTDAYKDTENDVRTIGEQLNDLKDKLMDMASQLSTFDALLRKQDKTISEQQQQELPHPPLLIKSPTDNTKWTLSTELAQLFDNKLDSQANEHALHLSEVKQLLQKSEDKTHQIIQEALDKSNENGSPLQRIISQMVTNAITAERQDLQTHLENLIKSQPIPDNSEGTPVTSDSPDTHIREVVQQQLDAFAADKIGKRDFALLSGGAHVVHGLTSATYEVESPNWVLRMLNMGKLVSRPPEVALMADTSLGKCWAFSTTSSGYLTIRLSHPVILSEISIEHVDPRLAYDSSSAPREVEVYAVYGYPSMTGATTATTTPLAQQRPQRKYSPLLLSSRSTKHSNKFSSPFDIPTMTPSMQTDITQPHKVLIAQFQYQPSRNNDIVKDQNSPQTVNGPIQTFSVRQDVVNDVLRRRPVRTISVVIKNNWGNKDYTCLYRVRVHGRNAILK